MTDHAPRAGIVLASASPRRSELLSGAGVSFAVVPSDASETGPHGHSPGEGAVLNALAKARAVAAEVGPARAVLGADTVVALEGAVFGKPADAADAARMLNALSGKVHSVYTGVALVGEWGERTFVCETRVRFADLSQGAVEWYVGTGEPLDKAGGYGIQGRAAGFVLSIEGSYTNVVGLPLAETLALLSEVGVFGYDS